MMFKKNQSLDETALIEEKHENVSSPFQPIVENKDDELAKRSLLRDILVETLKSPIIKTEKKENNIEAVYIEKEIEEIQVDLDLSPEYATKPEISSIKELKEMIAKNRPPKVSLIINNDLSKLTQSEREKVEKINSLDSSKVINQLKNDIKQLDNAIDENSQDITKGKPSSMKLSFVEEPKIEEKPSIKYLSADEIIMNHRKEENEKKAKTSAFLALKDDEKSFDDMAKLYYQSDIKEYE